MAGSAPLTKGPNGHLKILPSVATFQVEKDEDGGWVYAMEDGKRVGQIAWQFGHDSTRVELKGLSVKNERRGRGLGRALLEQAVAYLQAHHPQAKVAYGEVYSGSALRAWGQVFPQTEVRNYDGRLRTLAGMARRLDGYGFEGDREPPFGPCRIESPFPRNHRHGDGMV